MRPFRDTISIAEALARVMERAVPIARVERVPLAAAAGRVLAEAVIAPADVPPFDRAAMDGFAVTAASTSGASRDSARTLRRVDVVYAGEVSTHAVHPGECIEIATGAPMPAGADAVVMVEDTDGGSEGQVRVFSPVQPGHHVGRRGSDLQSGSTILQQGAFLNPSRIGALAAAGMTGPAVYARPLVAILSTGNELVQPGDALGPGQIYDVNSQTLSAVISLHGGEPRALPAAPDTLEGLTAALAAAAADVIVVSGGSSVGDRDLVLDVLRASGEVLFHGIAVKPGKPTAFGLIGPRPVLGMPGNPTSCLSNAYLLLAPMLRRMARLPPHRPHTTRLPLAKRIVSTPGRHQFYTVRIENGLAVPAFKASGDITSMAHADGYIEIAAETPAVEADDIVEVRLF